MFIFVPLRIAKTNLSQYSLRLKYINISRRLDQKLYNIKMLNKNEYL